MLIEDVLTEFKRTHLEHIEDIIITDGYVGGQAVVEYFRGLLLTLKGTSSEAMSVSVKWDGAPAVVCGTNPDNGRVLRRHQVSVLENTKDQLHKEGHSHQPWHGRAGAETVEVLSAS
jgi:hypothetical protein